MSSDDVKNAIRNLPDDFRLIVVLSLLEGFSYQEIAEITGFPLNAVRSRLHRGRRLLQKRLFDQDVCEGDYGMAAGRVRSTRMG
jgi:RNA polymerase sigma-70 factor (ECF subfamily)